MQTALAVLLTLFAWWFSTGAIFWAVSRPGNLAFRAALAAPLGVLAAVLLDRSGEMTGIGGVWLGFAAALGVWGWFELAFLAGILTGPRRTACPPGASGWRRFRFAWETVAHHELALAAVTLVLVWLMWDDANRAGLWCFLVLFAARISAKLNLFLGVPNFSDELMPERMAHLKSYFRRRSLNPLMPVSISLLTLAAGCFAERALAAPAGSGAETGFTVVATLTALAAVEHWLMILPLKETVLWRWMARATPVPDPRAADPAD